MDHVECRCQPAPRPASRRKSPAHKQEAKDRSSKPRYKDELHRRDELKPNQRLKLEDLLSHSWLPVENGQDAWSHNKTHHEKSRGHFLGDGRKYNSSSNATIGWSSERLTNPPPNHIDREDTGLLLRNVTRVKESMRKKEMQKNSTVNDDRLTNQSLVNGVNSTEITNQISQHESVLIQCAGHSQSAESTQVHGNETASRMETNQNQMHREARVTQPNHATVPKPAEKTHQKQDHAFNVEKAPSARIKGNETPEMESTQEETGSSSTLLKARKALEEEKEELLLLHKRLDEEKHKHNQKAQQHSQHEDQKQHHPHHTPQQTHTTTQRTGKYIQT